MPEDSLLKEFENMFIAQCKENMHQKDGSPLSWRDLQSPHMFKRGSYFCSTPKPMLKHTINPIGICARAITVLAISSLSLRAFGADGVVASNDKEIPLFLLH